jgi:6-phospho-beta-glucosidase
MDIIKDIEELCPDAWLVNFTNPAGMVTEAVFRHTNFKKFVGLCNVPLGMHMGLRQLLDVDADRLRIDFAGLNHMVFGLNFYLDGEQINERAMEALQSPDAHISMANIMAEPWEPGFTRGLNVMPCPYLRYYWKHGDMLKKDVVNFENNGTRAEVVKGIEDKLFELYKNPQLKEKPKELESRGGAYYSDAACNLISSIYNDKGDIQVVNTLNKGAITNLPYDSAVEVSSIITKAGPRPISMGDLPEEIIGIVRQIKTFERLTTDVAVTGDRDKAVTALTINPLIPSDRMAKVLFEEMLEAHRKYLPQFEGK